MLRQNVTPELRILNIKQKLKLKLDKVTLEESDVIYFLIEAGKLIELNDLKSNYRAIWFYRNWVAHSKIDKKSSFLNELKSKLEKINFEKGQAIQVIFGFISFADLKNEIIRFSHQKIENNLIPSTYFWDTFHKSLIQILADTPIVIDFGDRNVDIVLDQNGEFIINNLIKFQIKMRLEKVGDSAIT